MSPHIEMGRGSFLCLLEINSKPLDRNHRIKITLDIIYCNKMEKVVFS